jgi:hypothetical protein
LFFKYCVHDVGRLLRVDGRALDKEHFDYACILLATSSLEVINMVTIVMVEDVVMTFKVVEEWSFSLGEDVCLFEDEEDSVSNHSI